MTRLFVVALALLCAQPAHAWACHRFHVWRYPTPQRCGFTALARHVQSPAPAEERVSIEITITPELLETWAREDAIERLKAQSR